MAQITLTQIRHALSEAHRQTARVGDEIYYPAWWRYGKGVGAHPTTSEHIGPLTYRRSWQEARREIAAEHVAASYGLPDWEARERGQVYTLAGAAYAIRDALVAQS